MNIFFTFFSAILVGNILLTQAFGLYPLLGLSKKSEHAYGISIASSVMIVIAAILAYVLEAWVIVPLGLGYMRLMIYLLMVAVLVQFVIVFLKQLAVSLHDRYALYFPIVILNSALFAILFNNTIMSEGFFVYVVYTLGASIGFAFVMINLTYIRQRLEASVHVPAPFKGTAIMFIVLSLFALAMSAFSTLQ